MTEINMVDLSGRGRSDKDLQDAIQVLRKRLVSMELMKDPELFVLVPTMIDGLQELLWVRGKLFEARAAKAEIPPVPALGYDEG